MEKDMKTIIEHLKKTREQLRSTTSNTWVSASKKVRYMDYINDAINALEQHEPVIAKVKHTLTRHYYVCGFCETELDCRKDNYCSKCGRKAVYWDD